MVGAVDQYERSELVRVESGVNGLGRVLDKLGKLAAPEAKVGAKGGELRVGEPRRRPGVRMGYVSA
jgi:hypothetical protein